MSIQKANNSNPNQSTDPSLLRNISGEGATDADSIRGVYVDDTAKADGYVLSYDANSENIIYTVGGSGGGGTATITSIFGTCAPHTVLVGPASGANAVPTMRTLVTSDIPDLFAAKITSGTFAVAQIGTGSASAGSYVDGGTGAWTALPASGGVSTSIINTWTAQQVFETGVSGGSPVVFRKTGGTAGTDEFQIYQVGTTSTFRSMSGDVAWYLGPNPSGSSANALYSWYRNDGQAYATLTYNGFRSVGFTEISNIAFSLAKDTVQGDGLFLANTSIINWAPGGHYQTSDFGFARAGINIGKITNGSTGGGGLSSPHNSPTTLSANTNNYDCGVGLSQRWGASAPINITGMVAGVSGEWRTIINVGSSTIILTNQDASSTSANRWLTTTGSNVTLAANQMAQAMYDATTGAWRVSVMP